MLWLWIVAGFLFVWAIVSTAFMLHFAMRVLTAQDAVDDCLDELDACYATIAGIAVLPVANDSLEVRTVVDAVNRARNSVHHVAEVLEIKSELYNIDMSSDDQEEVQPESLDEGEKYHYRKLVG